MRALKISPHVGDTRTTHARLGKAAPSPFSMLCKRVIPTLLCRGYNLVKGKQFACDRVVGNVIQAVKVYNKRWVDELVVFDVDARKEGRCIATELVSAVAAENLVPLTVGGGVSTVKQAKELIQQGADKVAIGFAWERVDLITEISRALGAQAITVAVNYKEPYEAVSHAKVSVRHGAGEIILQCIERDGMMEGYDLETAFHVSSSVDVPVVLSSGAGSYEHLWQGLQVCDAVAAASLWHFTEATPKEAKIYLKAKGENVRIV